MAVSPEGTILDGKVAVVTGAARGLGRAYALAYARAGAAVVVNDRGVAVEGGGHDPSPAEDVAAEIRSAGGRAVADDGDVGSFAGGRAVVEAAVAAFGRVDSVVHNAGIRQSIAIADLTEDDFATLLAVHLRGAVGVVQGAFASMPIGGNVTLVTSGSGLNPQSGTIPSYAAAKAGVYGLMKVASFEGAPLGIRVNAISPVALTRMSERHLSTSPQAAELEPDRVARVAVYLASDAARELTGHVIRVVGRQICAVAYAESDPIEGDWTFETLAEAIPKLLHRPPSL